jgi:uncharacterized membrane protein YgaE (UPF0421/DUF939 family)
MKKISVKKINKRAFKRSFFGSISRLIGVALGAGAGSLLYEIVGKSLQSYIVASLLAVISFVLMWFSEYNREND